MRFSRRVLVVLAGLTLAFVYGFAASAYRLFPFYQVAFVKNALIEPMRARDTRYVPASPQSVVVLETALQRLLVKRVALPNSNREFGGGGAMTGVDSILYVFNTDGALLAFDVGNQTPLVSEVSNAPINRAALMQSRLRYEIQLPFFRVIGAFAEAESDSIHRIFVYHNRFDVAKNCITANVSRISVSLVASRVVEREAWRTIWTAEPCLVPVPDVQIPFSGHISGGAMLSYDTRRLLVAVGDFSHDGKEAPAYAMDPTKPYGKYLLVDKETGQASTYASGMRNAMGLFRDRDGTIWSTESGPQGGDELNVVREGGNLGWPLMTFGIDYDTKPWPSAEKQGRHERFDHPVFAWLPSVVPTGVLRFENNTSDAFSLWSGDLLIGTLRDLSLRRLRLNRDGQVTIDERIYLGERIRSIRALHDGTLVALTDQTGYLLFLADGGPVFEPVGELTLARVVDLDRYDRLVGTEPIGDNGSSGDVLFARKCASCHAVDERHMIGPSLQGVLGRTVGGADGYRYSSQLTYDGRTWTDELLSEFLLHPEQQFLNTRMPKVALSRSELDSLIPYLRSLQK